MTNKRRVLVTGGAGFLGFHLCQRLLAQNYQVLCLDNFSSSNPENIATIITHPQFELIDQDICEALAVKVDLIYHLACPASPAYYQQDPIQTTRISLLGSLNVLNLARSLQIPILFASTSEVYGDPLVHPQTESYFGNVNPIGPRACYDEGKRCAESLFMDYHRVHALDIRIARIFNTYGPHMHLQDGRVISNFINQALNNEPLTIYGDGSQSRSFCYVDDTIEGLLNLMAKPNQTLPINLGNPHEISIYQLAQTILTLTNSQSLIVYLPLPQDDPKQRCPDITQAITALGWTPQINLEQGLQKTINYFQNLTRR